jgi:hypothetical protein
MVLMVPLMVLMVPLMVLMVPLMVLMVPMVVPMVVRFVSARLDGRMGNQISVRAGLIVLAASSALS